MNAVNSEALEHRAAKVSLVNGISTVLSVAFQLISVPVCLHYWGSDGYGSWLALFSAFMLLRGLDGGFVTYVGNKLNYLYHQDHLALHKHLASAVFGILALGGLQLALASGTLLVEPLSTMLGIPADQHDGLDSKLGLIALMLSWVLTGSYLGIVHRLLIPAGRMYQAAWWATAFQVCQFAAIMIAATARLNMLRTSLLFALAQVGIYVASAIYVRRVLPGFSPWLRGAHPRVGFKDLGHSLFLTTSNIIQQSTFNGSVLLLSALAGPVVVPMFTTVRTLTNIWNSVTTILSTPLVPDVVRIHAKGEVHKLVSINRAYWVLVGSAVSLGSLLTYPLIPIVYTKWTAHAVTLDQPLLCMLLGSLVVANGGALMALHLNGINSLRIVLGTSVARAICGLGGGALGFKHYGLLSFGIGILSGEVIATLMTGSFFIRYEITAKGARIAALDLGPVLLSTGSVLFFFVGAGFGWWRVGVVWVLASGCVAVASIWGWRTLERELQVRLTNIPLRFFGR